MRDVAGLAGVSLSTVSAVVNNKGIVSPELAARVRQAIEAIGFNPHAGARGLRSGRTHIIGLIIQDLTNPFFVEIMQGVEEEAQQNGYEVMVCNSNDRPDLERRHLNAMQAQRVDGILLAICDSYAAREIPVRNLPPIVFVDCIPLKKSVKSVVTNNFDASYEAIKYLVGLGHHKIVVVSGRSVHSTSIDRVEGCRKRAAGSPTSHPRRIFAARRFPHRERIPDWPQLIPVIRPPDRNLHVEQQDGSGDFAGTEGTAHSLPRPG
jgi:DNA-binding LacI/PurR family transcriptional regulator